MFDLKSKILGRKQHKLDFGDVRSHVINERPFPEPQTIANKFSMSKPPSPPPGRFQENDFPDPFQSRSFDEPAQPAPVTEYPSRYVEKPRLDYGMDRDQSKYELLDRLSIIESQLSAIRSQTETINERLKNLETRLVPRRY